MKKIFNRVRNSILLSTLVLSLVCVTAVGAAWIVMIATFGGHNIQFASVDQVITLTTIKSVNLVGMSPGDVDTADVDVTNNNTVGTKDAWVGITNMSPVASAAAPYIRFSNEWTAPDANANGYADLEDLVTAGMTKATMPVFGSGVTQRLNVNLTLDGNTPQSIADSSISFDILVELRNP